MNEAFSANKSGQWGGLFLLAPGFFHPPLHNSFVFEVRLLKFCTELLWDKMNILR